MFEVKYKAKDQKCNINRKINLMTIVMGSVRTENERNTYVVRTENIARHNARQTYQPRDYKKHGKLCTTNPKLTKTSNTRI